MAHKCGSCGSFEVEHLGDQFHCTQCGADTEYTPLPIVQLPDPDKKKK